MKKSHHRQRLSKNVWFAFLLGCIAMLALQSTILRPPYPSTISFPRLSSSSSSSSLSSLQEAGNFLSSSQTSSSSVDCSSLAGMKILILDLHWEGNLGDEMETTPVLEELKRCGGVHITAILSRWLERPEQRIGGSSIREHSLVDVLVDPSNVDTVLSENDYHAVLLAPGPWRLCPLKQYWPYRIDIFMGGSIIPEQPDRDCDLADRFQTWKPSLLVVREPYSFGRVQDLPSLEDVPTMMSGDLSHSFQPVNVTLNYWNRVYGTYKEQILIFVRGTNADKIVQIKTGAIELTTLMNGNVSIPSNSVLFATSSPIEDAAWMNQKLQQQLANLQQHQFVQCQSVEQLWGLISRSTHVYTDRYHPGVIAHRFGKKVMVLDYKEEQTKLLGLAQIVESKRYTPAAIQTEYNPQAFNLLRKTLLQLKARPLQVLKTGVETNAGEEISGHHYDGEQPYAIGVGLPKSGSTSLYHFFSCSGYQATHYCCCGSTATEYPCTGGKLFSQHLWDNRQGGRPLWEGTGDRFVHAQLDGESPTETYILPQHTHLQELHDSAPNAIWILPLRTAGSWKKSVQNWLDMESRLRALYERYYPSSNPFDLATFYDEHTQKIRNFCAKNRLDPSLCVEVELDDPNAGRHLAKHFRNAVASCWGKHNAGPFFQAFPPKQP